MGDWHRKCSGDGYECWAVKGVCYGKKQGMMRGFVEQSSDARVRFQEVSLSAACVQWIKGEKKAVRDNYLLNFNKYLS